MLKLHGAKREFYISDLVTHVITESINFPEYDQAKDAKLAIVKVMYYTIVGSILVGCPGE